MIMIEILENQIIIMEFLLSNSVKNQSESAKLIDRIQQSRNAIYFYKKIARND